MDKAIISGEYVTFKHVKTRKVVVLEIEVPEENFQEVIRALGMPVGGNSKPVAVALLDASIVTKPQSVCDKPELTEGEKLRTRAVLLCDDKQFQQWAAQSGYHIDIVNPNPTHAAQLIRKVCDITSRSELATNINAQYDFKRILGEFDAWKVSQQYADNLNR